MDSFADRKEKNQGFTLAILIKLSKWKSLFNLKFSIPRMINRKLNQNFLLFKSLPF